MFLIEFVFIPGMPRSNSFGKKLSEDRFNKFMQKVKYEWENFEA